MGSEVSLLMNVFKLIWQLDLMLQVCGYAMKLAPLLEVLRASIVGVFAVWLGQLDESYREPRVL